MIIVYPCQWLTHSLTDDLVEDLMNWPLLMELNIWAMLTLKWNWGLAANSLKHLAKLAKLATAVTAVKAGDNELTLSDGIKYLSNVDVVMKLRCSCQQLVTAQHFAKLFTS